MPRSPYISSLRQKLGPDLVLFPAVCGLVFNDKNELLLNRRADNGRWSVLGGMIEPHEQPADALVREVLEETAVLCRPERITGLYLTPVTTYANGDNAQFIITTFLCHHLAGTPRVNDEESLEVRYFPLTALPDLRPHHLERITHATQSTTPYFTPPTLPEYKL